MKAIDIINDLYELTKNSDFGDYSNTCDTCKAGDMNVEPDKIAVSMFATPEIIRQAKEWGAQLLIVHEPTYYNHWDKHSEEKLECEKRKLIEESGLTIFRYHDHPHFTSPDIIAAGELRQLGLDGQIEYTDVPRKTICQHTSQDLKTSSRSSYYVRISQGYRRLERHSPTADTVLRSHCGFCQIRASDRSRGPPSSASRGS